MPRGLLDVGGAVVDYIEAGREVFKLGGVGVFHQDDAVDGAYGDGCVCHGRCEARYLAVGVEAVGGGAVAVEARHEGQGGMTFDDFIGVEVEEAECHEFVFGAVDGHVDVVGEAYAFASLFIADKRADCIRGVEREV